MKTLILIACIVASISYLYIIFMLVGIRAERKRERSKEHFLRGVASQEHEFSRALRAGG